ncbi:hypothetical protein [Reyranella sp.]|jgi:hypothetical protein|uniref:hypothetical protein n=1 Tax=Reyranella sp. TaxID=1929291 RepID=UPI000BDA02F7|nr:hypothetical protein [Reyranella sp.]OYY40615.1 MAG: hypothetical protein B7Y57_16310 [Rhodospirillales bacterium 35-66-84]OYZ93175.1 MAG: hypothetical protein B7Y08_17555 [Rhodospirillales bacterium 24-66-33]OZB24589.1 MAG: hypothetical protein B7X63_15525 [Rhodospirillales bacterium 39-66-50]HQS18111.1 hypothetical protein [Reyranella sp.]HQT14686.1 hypothetical protein [Reyranella sp.]
MSRPIEILAAALALSLSSVAASRAQEAWRGYEGHEAIEIPFANGPISLHHVPTVWLSLNGARPRWFGMDTGSTGIVVSAEHFIPGSGDVAQGPGQLVYNSSGRVLSGEHWMTDVVIRHDEHTPVATARVQVLRVDRITCLEHARDCRPEAEPRNVAFMGVGFDRGSAQTTASTTSPENPFVSLVALASGRPVSSVRPGYVITRTGVHLGMTPDLTRHMAFVKLTPKPHPPGVPDWNGAPMTVSVDGVTGRGTLLMDTGINYMFLSPPAGTRLEHGRHAPDGTRIELFMPDRQRPQPAFYEFRVGRNGNPLHPERVEVVRDATVFVNTGRMFLEGFDYLYDAVGGYVGYGWNGRVSHEYGGVTPGAPSAP